MPGLVKFVFNSAPYRPENRSDSMGKCVSKQTSATAFIASSELTGNGDTKRFSSASSYVPFYDHDDAGDPAESISRKGSLCSNKSCKNGRGPNNEGQSESKKGSKRSQAQETKGTAMSFGFRKKLHSSNKKNALLNNKDKEKEVDVVDSTEKYHSATVISNPGLVRTDDLITANTVTSDKNGNSGSDLNICEKSESKRPTLRTVPLRRETSGIGGAAHRSNRFGFKSSNIVRPASAGLTPKLTEFDESVENNNVTEKRRSKSASGGGSNRSQSISDSQGEEYQSSVPKISPSLVSAINSGYQEKPPHSKEEKRISFGADTISQASSTNRPPNQYTVINTGMHTNVIVKPSPQQATSVARFTLHTTSLPKPQYPVPISLSSATSTTRTTMDTKNAKQLANSNRKGGFHGPREISTDSGIASLDNNYDNMNYGNISPRRGSNSSSNGAISRGRPRNLEMVFRGRHKFEVRDLDDSLSFDSVEPLVLPKLPSVFSSNNQTVPLNGLIRANLNQSPNDEENETRNARTPGFCKVTRAPLSDSESIDEEKLFRDRSTSEKTTKNPSIKEYNLSSKNSSPGSSRVSWCNAGESLAVKDCSSLSLSSSDDSKDNQNEKTANDVVDVNISSITLSENPSMLSSFTATLPKSFEREPIKEDRTTNIERLVNIAESKFAEMAANVPDVLLDDETSPTDSLVSSTESDEILLKKNKKKSSEETTQEKDIDEISPELEICSPVSLGTPTHASNSFSLSDGGRDFLIDDEIADQPALLFSDKADLMDSTHIQHPMADTPTLMESLSARSSLQHSLSHPQQTQNQPFHSQSKSKGVATPSIELSLKTPIARKRLSLLNRAESLDTLSPCESIASDDLMMDFESHSSMDSIDRLSHSIRSRAGSAALHAMDDEQLRSELETRSGEVLREWNNILRQHRSSKDSILSQLPARATRLLNRSRLQQSQLSNAGSDSPKSTDSLPRKTSRASSLHFSGRDPNSSSDDLFFHDKSFRNSMIQDVLYFKKQLIRLRRILQEQHQDEENLTRTDTLNPFELGNGQFFGSCGLDSDKELGGSSLAISTSTIDDQRQELADLRRQVVYLQGQIDDRDRTIRLQKNLIDKLESERQTVSVSTSISEKECVNSATQTERIRPLSIGHEGLTRSKPDAISYITYSTALHNTPVTPIRRQSAISTSYNNLNQISQLTPRLAALGWEKFHHKPVKISHVNGENTSINNNNNNNNNNNEVNNLNHTFNHRNTNGNHNGDTPLTKHSTVQNGNSNGINSLKYIKLKSPTRLMNGVQSSEMNGSAKYYSRSLSNINSILHNSSSNSNKSFDEINGDHRSPTITIV